jgi:hypothetical protein
MSEYAERDPMQLDKMGNYYSRHVEAMTAEGLHDKADIAAELAVRDAMLDDAKAKLKEESHKSFVFGVAWAAGFHGEFGGCNTHEFINEAGLTWEDLREAGVPDFDLRKIARAIGKSGVRSLRRKKHS